MEREDKKMYSVVRKKEEAPGIVTLQLAPVGTDRPAFTSGQFITVYFPELDVPEGKAYSISSSPHEDGLSVTVKDIGVFSHRLCTMEIGECLVASDPYGFFYSEESDSTLVLLAGGIGVAPLRSMISDTLHNNPERKISLHYSVSNYSDAAFLEELLATKERHLNFSYAIHVTKGPVAGIDCLSGRISVDKIAFQYKDDPKAEYLMCGSIPFVRDMWKALRACDVPEERLYTEAFFV